MKFRNRFFSIAAAGVVAFGAVTPVFATDLTSTGNGYGSQNVISTTSSDNTTVSQSNTATVTNRVDSVSDTGNNSASYNTGGDSTVVSGDASTRTSIDNRLNANSATTACCTSQDLSVLEKGNGADSTNTVSADMANNKTVVQTNSAAVDNAVRSDANTGDNAADYNTGGTSRILTGNADTRTGVATQANSNVASIGGSGSSGPGSAYAEIQGNGAYSLNGLSLSLANNSTIGQDNQADVSNDIYSTAKSGDNSASYDTGGNARIETGNASALTGVATKANQNIADLSCCGSLGFSALIYKNGYGSENTMALNSQNNRTVEQSNAADVANYVDSNANSGYNAADYNTGGSDRIFTGDTRTANGIDNLLNFNHASLDCCVSDLSAVVDKNGADSLNGISSDLQNNQADYQTNSSYLDNVLGGENGSSSLSGYNDASYNTADPLVYTGNSVSMNHVSNVANKNDAGGRTGSLPGVEFNFSMDWMNSLMSMVH